MTGQAKATLRNLRMSPRKVRLFIDLVRGMNAAAALQQLSLAKRVAAVPVSKLIASAMANAKNNHGLNPETLMISQAFVDGGPMQYRWTPRAMGRATPIRRRTSHITIVLTGDALELKKGKKEMSETVDGETKEVIKSDVKKSTAPRTKKTAAKSTKKKT